MAESKTPHQRKGKEPQKACGAVTSFRCVIQHCVTGIGPGMSTINCDNGDLSCQQSKNQSGQHKPREPAIPGGKSGSLLRHRARNVTGWSLATSCHPRVGDLAVQRI